jgi:hypothetical protein
MFDLEVPMRREYESAFPNCAFTSIEVVLDPYFTSGAQIPERSAVVLLRTMIDRSSSDDSPFELEMTRRML